MAHRRLGTRAVGPAVAASTAAEDRLPSMLAAPVAPELAYLRLIHTSLAESNLVRVLVTDRPP
ncbi:hypothetical protein GCM10027186_53580 [Micromonospora schwarzwaldensis]